MVNGDVPNPLILGMKTAPANARTIPRAAIRSRLIKTADEIGILTSAS